VLSCTNIVAAPSTLTCVYTAVLLLLFIPYGLRTFIYTHSVVPSLLTWGLVELWVNTYSYYIYFLIQQQQWWQEEHLSSDQLRTFLAQVFALGVNAASDPNVNLAIVQNPNIFSMQWTNPPIGLDRMTQEKVWHFSFYVAENVCNRRWVSG